jgi:poly [ADP-ribose] polymerase
MKSDKDEDFKKVIIKGKVPVDEYYIGPKNVHVLEQDGKIYSDTLNNTSIKNNDIKYYILQILEMDNSNDCYFWTRWGRVGAKGLNALVGPYSR